MTTDRTARSAIVAIAPYGMRPGARLGDTPLADCITPLGTPPALEGGTLGDLGPDDHVLFHPKSTFYWPKPFGVAAKVSLVIAEPYAVHRRHYQLLPFFHRRFFRILSRRQGFVDRVPNAIFFNHVFAYAADVPEGIAKTRPASIIASARRTLEGHRLRHTIVDRVRAEGLDVDVLGRGYTPFEKKWEGLAPYRFSVVIENSREPFYFTEKIIDACLCRTVPIYWGAPDIGDHFNADGLIICDSGEAIMEVLRGIDEIDLDALAPAIDDNLRRAQAMLNTYEEMAELLLKEAGQGT